MYDFRTICPFFSSQLEFSSGLRRSAMHTARATRTVGVIRTSRNIRDVFILASSSIVRVTSTSVHSVTCGAVNALSTIARAVARRMPVTSIRVSPRSVRKPDQLPA